MKSDLRYAWETLPATAFREDPSLQREWNRLNALGGNLPFLDAKPVINAIDTFGGLRERLLIARQDGLIVAMLVVAPTGKLRWQTFQPSQIPLGTWVAEPAIDPRALSASLFSNGDLKLAFSVTQIDPLFTPCGNDCAKTQASDYIETGWVDIAGDFEAYWNARGKNLRQNMRKQRNKMEAEAIVGRTRKITLPDDMAAAIQRYGMLEAAGWKAASGTAIHPDNAQGHFYFRLLKEAAAEGEAVVYEYLFNDRTVASNICLARGDTITILKTTYDESTHPYSPAFLLLQDILEQLHGEGRFKRLEFYGRMMEWHSRWTDNKRSLYHLTCYRWPLLKKLAAARRERSNLVGDKTERVAEKI